MRQLPENNIESISSARSQWVNTETIRLKVEQDIAFLSDRIAALKNHPRPNRVVIDTYQSMLDSRLSVLKWLQHGQTSHSEKYPRASGE